MPLEKILYPPKVQLNIVRIGTIITLSSPILYIYINFIQSYNNIYIKNYFLNFMLFKKYKDYTYYT